MAEIKIKVEEHAERLKVLEHARKNHSKIHLIGCVSPGGLHSHEGHLIGLLNFFVLNNFSSVYVHMMTDGEDSLPSEGMRSLDRIKEMLSKLDQENILR